MKEMIKRKMMMMVMLLLISDLSVYRFLVFIFRFLVKVMRKLRRRKKRQENWTSKEDLTLVYQKEKINCLRFIAQSELINWRAKRDNLLSSSSSSSSYQTCFPFYWIISRFFSFFKWFFLLQTSPCQTLVKMNPFIS